VPDPEVVRSRPLPARPDPARQLTEAIQERDGLRTRRLVEVWVHRRGLHSLRDFCTTTLPASLDAEELVWLELQGLLPWSVGSDPFCPTAVVDQALASYVDAVADPEPDPELDTHLEPRGEASPAPAPLAAAAAVAAAPEVFAIPPEESLVRTAPARARRLLSRARVLLRDCLQEVWEGLGGASTPGRLPDDADPPLSEVVPPVDVLPVAPVAIPSLIPAPSAAVAVERLRPRPLLSVPRLPRASRPAPAPADLADLRMWLPDPIEDLPRAC